jgi:hypothetical protein
MRKTHSKMQNTRHHGFKKEIHSANQFNDSEYKRWSEAITRSQSPKTEWGIESFLGTNENLQPVHQDISISLVGIGSRTCSLCNASYELETQLRDHEWMSHAGRGIEESPRKAVVVSQPEDRQV